MSLLSFVSNLPTHECPKKVNTANSWLLAVSTAFMVLQNINFGGVVAGASPPTSRPRDLYLPLPSPGLQHVDITHNGYLRLQNLYKLGTSPTLRREVNTLGLHDFILSEADVARASIGNADTTPLSLSAFDHPRRQLRLGGASPRVWAWRSILSNLERPFTYVLFILVSASRPRTPASPLLLFADVATLENSNRSVYGQFLALRGYVDELGRALESMSAFYEVRELESAFARPSGRVYATQVREIGEDGKVYRGMHIEFR